MIRHCPYCGKEFAAIRNKRFCSKDCRVKYRQMEDRGASGNWYLIEDYNAALAAAKKQPPWCSDARWRIELSRRRDPSLALLPESPVSLQYEPADFED